ncbi:TetR family transcriptional regulator C-terminal domain-containing protein [Curtobacterium sp. MCLR17_036]|uniref:TetR/AcrR family transcriptional regulator n=1 Tax=Curtobacterium sp. MCLR17_036 TaxID=2175620 RepID=UPI0021AD11B6|nr:TetR family transcriptional regulator C-terminal domain-containing protein [Curtobacterium sp. MCLR17_036]WIE65269.1 TetR family transcriptional regulator C-terminal domain-containing protein [Curtobacterium sp. MCLR17_036]
MARSIDIEDRRRVVSEAACRVLAEDGLGALSVRNVSAAAGLPPSTVRYVFPTQASMREHTITLVFDRMCERIEALPADLPAPKRARRIVVELLPLDAERVIELDVYLALGNAALTDAALRPTLDGVVGQVRAWCEEALGLLGVPPRDHEYEARRLHALLDGLAMQVVRLAPGESGVWAIDVVDRHLTELAPA